ncbi:MAG: hypothetical protein LBH32_12765 [Dysgonamonadaceae bacterium]|jgi:hypothetical protein|nr:hypothetical protein [Dysgonamonadaceae bacterium]
MIRKKLLFFMSLTAMTAIFTGCLNSGGNRASYSYYAVMVYNPEIMDLTMNAPEPLLVPELQGKVKEGDCMRASYTIDFDNQPTGSLYYTATNVSIYPLNKRTLRIEGGDMIDDHNDSINNIRQIFGEIYFDGKIFVIADQQGNANQLYKLEAICNPDSVDENGIHTVYLKSKKDNETSGDSKTSVSTEEAIDMNPMLAAYGKDSIYSLNKEVIFRYVNFNLKYQSGTVDGAPVYRSYGNSPITVLSLKK